MSLPVAILAGGLATRLGAVADATPKALVDVNGTPFALHQLALLRRHGLTDLVFLIGHLGDRIRDLLGDGSSYGVRVRYVEDGPLRLGTGGAIRNALSAFGERFFVLYGDSYLECDYAAVEAAFRAAGADGLMTVCRNDDQWDASNVHFEQGRIVRYDKVQRTPAMRHIDYGLGAFRPEAFDGWPAGEPFDLSAVFQRLLRDGRLAAFEVSGRFFEVGSLQGLAETRAHLAAKGASLL